MNMFSCIMLEEINFEKKLYEHLERNEQMSDHEEQRKDWLHVDKII